MTSTWEVMQGPFHSKCQQWVTKVSLYSNGKVIKHYILIGGMSKNLHTFYLFIFSFLGPHPQLYGGSQASGRIRATAAGLCHSHSNTRSLTHWEKPGIKSASSWMLVRFISTEPWWELLLPSFCCCCCCLFVCLFVLFFGCASSTRKFLGQGLNPSHSSENTRSLLTTRPPEDFCNLKSFRRGNGSYLKSFQEFPLWLRGNKSD